MKIRLIYLINFTRTMKTIMNRKNVVLAMCMAGFFTIIPSVISNVYATNVKYERINLTKRIYTEVKFTNKPLKRHITKHKNKAGTWKRHLKKQEEFTYSIKQQILSAKMRKKWREENISYETQINLNDIKNKYTNNKVEKKQKNKSVDLGLSDYRLNQGPDVEVGIISGDHEVQINAIDNFKIIADGKLLKEDYKGESLLFSRDNNKVKLNGKQVGSTIYLKSDGEAPFSVKGNRYRGIMKVIPARWNSGLTLINILPMENYLRGVIPREIIPSWKIDAIKAQAVAARTYAIFHKNGYRSAGYDVTADTRSQMYGGYSAETNSTDKAIRETEGEILTYNGSPIDAVFSANAGGYTENSENVWGSKVHYLRGVPEVPYSVIDTPWTKEFTFQTFSDSLNKHGINIGKLKNIKLSKLKKGPMSVSDRGISGRVKYIEVEGEKGTKRITGENMQIIFDLDSTLFDLNVKNKGKKIEIIGYGDGHGLGLSQWGAQAMAEKYGDGKNYYRRILSHYFTDTKIEKIY